MPLKCDVHKFTCETPSEMNVHFGEVEHTHSGTTQCMECGEDHVSFKYTGKLKNGKVPPARCEECLDRLKRELA